MTLFTDLQAQGTHRNLTLGILVEGIPTVFVERPVASTFSVVTGRTQIACITRVQHGEQRLDMDSRHEIAPTLDVEMLDDSDLTLQAIFAPATRRLTWVNADATAAATTIYVDSNAGVVDDAVLYVNGESLIVDTTVSTDQITVATRGVYGSDAIALTGASDDGDNVYLVPPSWVGRRVFLYGFTEASQRLLGVFIVDETPKHDGDRRWSMRCAGKAQEVFEKAIGWGIVDTPCVYSSSSVDSGRFIATFVVENLTAFRLGTSVPTYAVLTAGDDQIIGEVQNFDSGTGDLSVYLEDPPLFGTKVLALGLVTSARPMAVAQTGGSADALLYVLASREGQLAAGYDRLPGRLPSAFDEPGWSFGAGLSLTDDIDEASFSSVTYPDMGIIIDGERKLADALREFCLLANCAAIMSTDGLLTLISLSDTRIANAIALTGDDLMPDSRVAVLADEGTVYPFATVRLGYSPLSQDYTVELNLADTDLVRRYPRSTNRAQWEFRSIGCGEARRISSDRFMHPADASIGNRAAGLAKLLRGAGGGIPQRSFTIDVSLSRLDVNLGDLVTLSGMAEAFSELPDMAGGTIDGVTCRVIGRRPDFTEGRIALTLQVLERLLHVCPAAVISSVNTGTVQVTLATTGPEVTSTSPTDDFYVGAIVRIVDVSAENHMTTSINSIDSGTVMTLGTLPTIGTDGWEFAAGDYLVLDPLATADLTADVGPTASGYFLIEMASLVDDDGVSSGYDETIVDNTPRWR